MMTLDEAIQHCEEQVALLEESAEGCDLCDPVEKQIACKSGECAAEHKQLVEWLKELKRYHQAKDGLLEDMKALHCGFPYGLDYLIDCIKKRLLEAENKDNIAGWPF